MNISLKKFVFSNSFICSARRFKQVPTIDVLDQKHEKVQVGKDQEKAQSEKDFHSKNRGGKKPN